MIERMADYKYIKQGEITDQWLVVNGFQYDRIASDRDNLAYSNVFPVYKYEGCTLLDGVITIWPHEPETEKNRIRVNCYEHSTRNYFARFYYWEYGKDDEMMEIINKKIYRKMKDLGIKIIKPDGEVETDDT